MLDNFDSAESAFIIELFANKFINFMSTYVKTISTKVDIPRAQKKILSSTKKTFVMKKRRLP